MLCIVAVARVIPPFVEEAVFILLLRDELRLVEEVGVGSELLVFPSLVAWGFVEDVSVGSGVLETAISTELWLSINVYL